MFRCTNVALWCRGSLNLRYLIGIWHLFRSLDVNGCFLLQQSGCLLWPLKLVNSIAALTFPHFHSTHNRVILETNLPRQSIALVLTTKRQQSILPKMKNIMLTCALSNIDRKKLILHSTFYHFSLIILFHSYSCMYSLTIHHLIIIIMRKFV